LLELRPKRTKPYRFPKTVTECGGDGSIERVPGTAAYRCVARDSDALHRQRLYYFVSKGALNVDGVGPKIIDLLLEHHLINTYADLFTLKAGDLIDLPSFKERAAENVITAINNARIVPLHRLLVGLSIDHVGEETARLIASYCGTLENVREATVEELAAIHGVGDVVALSVVDWMQDPLHRKVLDELCAHISITETKGSQGGALTGKTFVFTGTLASLARSEAQDLARKEGAHISNSVSKKTDYVVAGEEAGSKAEKAKTLGVTILDEKAFLKLLG
jgi:DNA ligase (NAD+)